MAGKVGNDAELGLATGASLILGHFTKSTNLTPQFVIFTVHCTQPSTKFINIYWYYSSGRLISCIFLFVFLVQLVIKLSGLVILNLFLKLGNSKLHLHFWPASRKCSCHTFQMWIFSVVVTRKKTENRSQEFISCTERFTFNKYFVHLIIISN